jgi:hypothetical protein
MSHCPVFLLLGTGFPTAAARKAVWENDGTSTLRKNDFLERCGHTMPFDACYHGICIQGFQWLHGCDISHPLGFASMPLVQLLDGTWLTRRPSGSVDTCDPEAEYELWIERRMDLKDAGGNDLCEHHEDPPLVRPCPFKKNDGPCERRL